MYQLGSLFIFGSKLISVLGIALRMSCCLFPKIQMVAVFISTKPYWFWYKGFINNSLGVTWKFCPRNFKNSEIDCTISQKKNHSELQKFKKSNVAAIWLCKKLWLKRPETFENEWQKREHFLGLPFLMWLTWLI